jgi:threonine dehydratase
MIPSCNEVVAAYMRVKQYVHATPVLTSSFLNISSGAGLFFKCENFQRMGAFKMRGAIHAMLQLTDEEKQRGVVTHSSGNFAQAVSLAARELGITAHIVMPENSPLVKKEGVEAYGGIITESEATVVSREAEAERIRQQTGAVFLHPSNDINVILGQSTAAYELLLKHPDLDFILVPVGGGGLLAGTALAVNCLSKRCKIIGAEPFAADDAFRSLQSGTIERNETSDTIADGLRTTLGDKNFPIIKKLVSEIVRVEETEIVAAMRLLWERMKLVVEPSGAVPLAALLREKERFKGKKGGIILSGGNVDLNNLPF